ncbi:discoidin domain-containing protein [Pedobacter sp. N36a]|uniref:M60 family metallopeptidase n=1 Tax=Pedobacter sp. N36a TaxID=2767996 RepID=UPI001656FFEC|nr:M60 family metallopeptidase [Pedobacter sp. N36a]MBC8986301.1 discoidin domain-containing protein [Pedobacter sp. N36a]
MKNANFLSKLLMLLVLMGFISCKKYGYKFEDGFNASGEVVPGGLPLDTMMMQIDRTMYSRARIFPGMVEPSEPRVVNAKVVLDLNFSASNGKLLRINVAPEPQFSIGYYAPAGELIKIVVPAGINGLSVQVGGHTDNLTGKEPLQRDAVITNTKQLFPGVNYVRNLYGGTIYIRADIAFEKPVELTITGAVVSPDFVLGVSNDAQWIAQVKASTVPWLELRSSRVIFLIPRDFLIRNFNSSKPLVNPTALMKEWNAKFELDYNGWMGLSDNSADLRDRSPQSAWREVLDIQPSVGYGHNGFPVVATMDSEWFNSVISLEQLQSGANWGTYHEFGHNCQQPSIWSWEVLGETTNNLFNYKVANRNGANFSIQHGDDWVAPALAYAAGPTGAKKFDTDAGMNDPFKRMIPFLQIFEKYGYGAMTHLYTEARHATRLANTTQDKKDFVYERFSEFANVNLLPFFNAWGIEVSSVSTAKISKKFPLLRKKIWTYNPMTKLGGNEVYNPYVITATSEELTGEGAVNGRANAMIDGDNNTFWHSQWNGATGQMPHTIVLDVATSTTVKGLYFITRNSADQLPKDIEVYVSEDKTNWTKVGSKQLARLQGQKIEYLFPAEKTGRYFKVVILNNHSNSPYAALAELNIIKP